MDDLDFGDVPAWGNLALAAVVVVISLVSMVVSVCSSSKARELSGQALRVAQSSATAAAEANSIASNALFHQIRGVDIQERQAADAAVPWFLDRIRPNQYALVEVGQQDRYNVRMTINGAGLFDRDLVQAGESLKFTSEVRRDSKRVCIVAWRDEENGPVRYWQTEANLQGLP